jgi:transcription elongation factor GreA
MDSETALQQQVVEISQSAHVRLTEELDDLIHHERPRIAERIREAKEDGDLSENNDYIAAKQEQAFVEGRILELRQVLDAAVIIEPSTLDPEIVHMGSKVTLIDDDGDELAIEIVSPFEADPDLGRVSDQSPIGKSVAGRRVGNRIKWDAPGGHIEMTIKAISI